MTKQTTIFDEPVVPERPGYPGLPKPLIIPIGPGCISKEDIDKILDLTDRTKP